VTARKRIPFDLVDDILYLVDRRTVRAFPRTPLLSVYRTEITIVISPLVPDRNFMLFKPFDIRIATKKPEQFIDDALYRELLGREHRKARCQVISILITEHAARAGTSTIITIVTVVENMLKHIKVLTHEISPFSMRYWN
jgi:hypothetical protein